MRERRLFPGRGQFGWFRKWPFLTLALTYHPLNPNLGMAAASRAANYRAKLAGWG